MTATPTASFPYQRSTIPRARREGAPLPGAAYVAGRDQNHDRKLDWAGFNAAEIV